MTAVVAALDASEPDEIPALMRTVGMTLISKVGGAAGSPVRDLLPAVRLGRP